MNKKEKFVQEVEDFLKENDTTPEEQFSQDALDYWNALQISGDSGRPRFTDNGKLILVYMQKNKGTYNNLFKAKDVGEGLGISSRTASGAMRKLVNDLYIEKVGENPVIYSLTDKGVNVNVNEESQ